MRNRILYITKNTIPYVKELNPITNSILASLLMQQLDYWFDKYPDGFYKFLASSPAHPSYKDGDSWLEELGMSVDEFRTAYSKIGMHYPSKSKFMEAEDKFAGRFYASYVDRKQNLTFYYRNHALLDQKLDELVYRYQTVGTPPGGGGGRQVPDIKAHVPSQPTVNRESPFPGNGESQGAVNGESRFTANGESTDPQTGKAHVWKSGSPTSGNGETEGQGTTFTGLPTTEPTKDITRQQQQSPAQAQAQPAPVDNSAGENLSGERSSSFLNDLVMPKISELEQKSMLEAIAGCPAHLRQAVLDEVEGTRRAGTIKKGALPLANALINKAIRGEFTPSVGVKIEADRIKREEGARQQQLQMELPPAEVPAALAGVRGAAAALSILRPHRH